MARRSRTPPPPNSDDADGTDSNQQAMLWDAALASPPAQPKPHHVGHRQRLRDRFRKGGPEALPDYELIEMILFRALPQGDTKPLAKALLQRFGSFPDVINASEPRLREVQGVGERVVDELKLIRAASLRLMQGEIMGRRVLGTWRKPRFADDIR